CANGTANTATALDRGARQGETSNWDWVQQTAAQICAVRMGAGVNGGGHVTGLVSIPPDFDDGTYDLSSKIDCDEQTHFDCTELIHDDQSIVLTAVADDGWTFAGWTSGKGLTCPCDPASPTCPVPYQSIGYYSETDSIDESYCEAMFTLDDA